jgi:hypothetical protein
MSKFNRIMFSIIAGLLCAGVTDIAVGADPVADVLSPTNVHAQNLTEEGKQTFRFDTFGDEAFWGGALRLHEAIAGANHGGIGNGLSPSQALQLGLKVDTDALPADLVNQLRQSQVDLNDPASTIALLKLDAVLGVKGFFNENGTLQSVGITCALCHSTVNDSFAPGIGNRLDGWANRDLNVGGIIALAPDLSPFIELLEVVQPGIDDSTVRTVLNSWGPGKFDAQLILDGKAFRPDGGSAATMLPNAFGLVGFNLHTWTGDWGNVIYWNAFVAVLEMHGQGNFFDPRLDDIEKFPDSASRFPIAVAKQLGHIKVPPEQDLVTPKLPGLHLYQLSLPAPTPEPGVHFEAAAAESGKALFEGKAGCNACHIPPIWTEPGWNAHSPDEMKIDAFQAERSPDGVYKTANLDALFIRELGINMLPANKGRFYHDGRFTTLLEVVESYNERFSLGLFASEMNNLVEYLKSL